MPTASSRKQFLLTFAGFLACWHFVPRLLGRTGAALRVAPRFSFRREVRAVARRTGDV